MNVQQIKSALQRTPVFVILLPIFFVLHGFLDNYNFITVREFLSVTAIYTIGTVCLFALVIFFYKKNLTKAALVTFFLVGLNFFFGVIHDFLKSHLPFLSRYSILLSIFSLFLIALILRLRKTNGALHKPTLFLNTLLCIYLLADSVVLIKYTINPPSDKFSVASFIKKTKQAPVNILKPDIYFLLFDEYASSLALKKAYGFNNDLDSFLTSLDFHLSRASFSNYNYTPASMASMLNMNYLNGVHDSADLSAKDMNSCVRLINNNEVVKYLSSEGYDIINYSIFDLYKNLMQFDQSLLPLKKRLLTANTLLNKADEDLSLSFHLSQLFGIRSYSRYHTFYTNGEKIESVKSFSGTPHQKPCFIYAHYYMPHDPFYTDSSGAMKNEDVIVRESLQPRPYQAYLQYLSFTNGKIKELINTIKTNTKNQAVIILMGDHGFREHLDKNLPQNFMNMNAVYFPSKNYRLFYDSISCVNQFRVIFSSLFNQSIPLLKDSTIFLTGKQ